jgi:CheY-like chemotaxis protein
MSDFRRQLQDVGQRLPEFGDDLRALGGLLDADLQSALNKVRFITEKVLYKLCTAHGVSWGSAEPTLERMVGPLVAAEMLPRNVAVHVRTVQANANFGSHFQDAPPSAAHAGIAGSALIELLTWYAAGSYGAAAPPGCAAPGPGLRVLLVEELAFNQQCATGPLRKEGHTVEVAANGEEALGTLDKGTFDLILMQVQMHGMDGFELAARIRQREQEKRRSTPIIGMTSDPALRGPCLAAGMDGTMSRPLRLEEFLEAANHLNVIDWAQARARVGDMVLMHDLAASFLQEKPRCMGEVRGAIASQDAELVRKWAHSLKGVAGTFGASGAFQAALELEDVARRGDLSSAKELYATLAREFERLEFVLTRFVAEAGKGARPDNSPGQ